METILVTGGTGFIGANLVRELVAQGLRPHITLRPGSSLWRLPSEDRALILHELDFRNSARIKDLVYSISPDIVIHTACYGSYAWQTDSSQMLRVNVEGTLALLEASAQVGVKLFIQPGSSSEYGPKDCPMSEWDVLKPNRAYGVTKAAQTHLALAFRDQGLPTVVLRLFSVYGPWEQPGRLVPNLLSALLSQSCFHGSSPEVARDFVWIEDVVGILRDFDRLRKLKEPLLNVGTGIQTTLGDLVCVARRISKSSLETEWSTTRCRPWDTGTWVADTQRFQKLWQDFTFTKLETGMEKFYRWMQSHSQHYIGMEQVRKEEPL